jgi:acetyltransferase
MSVPQRNEQISADKEAAMQNEIVQETWTTRGGVTLTIRAAQPDDGPRLQTLFDQLTPEDLRFRFLSSVGHVGADRIGQMLAPPRRACATILGIDAYGEAVAAAMVATDDKGEEAEVAVSVRRDMKQHGVGWTMLDFVRRYARRQGFRALYSIESRDNRAAIDLEREAGFSFESCDGDPCDVIARMPLAS